VSKLARVLIACSAVLLAATGTSSCGGTSDEVVARVGQAAITKGALEHWMSVEAAAGSPARPSSDATAPVGDPGGDGTLKRRTLGFLISAAQMAGEAAEKGITATDVEAKRALKRLRYEQTGAVATSLRDAALQDIVLSKAQTPADQLSIVKTRLLAAKVKQRQLFDARQKLTDAQVASYYMRNRKRFVVPERRNVEVIETFRKAKIEKAKREIDAGQSLASVVERRNDEPDVGGLRLGLSRQSLTHGYESNYFKARAHVLVGPLKAEIYYLFEVTDIMPAKQQTLGEVQATIRQRLIAGPQRSLYTHLVRAFDEKWKRKTRCRPADMLKQCGGPLV